MTRQAERTGERGKLELLVDILNVLNRSTANAIQSEILSSQTFGEPARFMDPRQGMVGTKLVF